MIVVGMDEVGRGSWAGPAVVGAVILGETIPGLRDSKQLSVKSREKLAEIIRATALATTVGEASVEEIDELGLTAALRLAYERALAGITHAYDRIIIDGSYNFLPDMLIVQTIIKADATVPAVSAASIIAKVTRDKYMIEQAMIFPAYGFERHVGYGTSQHQAALRKDGPCAIHRQSFAPIQKLLETIA